MGYKEFQNELRKYKEKQEKCNHEKTTEVVFTNGEKCLICVNCEKLLI